MGILSTAERKKRMYHGTPRSNCDCMVMKFAKTPRFVALPTSMMMTQILSCTAGQWYF